MALAHFGCCRIWCGNEDFGSVFGSGFDLIDGLQALVFPESLIDSSGIICDCGLFCRRVLRKIGNGNFIIVVSLGWSY